MALAGSGSSEKLIPVWLQVNDAHDNDLLSRSHAPSDASSEWHRLRKTRIDHKAQSSGSTLS